MLKNASDLDLLDVILKSSLPPGTAFNRFEDIDYATTGFDGSDISYTILKIPARTTIGPLSSYIDPRGADPGTLQSKLYVEWRGQMPGNTVIPAAALAGAPAAAAQATPSPAAPQATPRPSAAQPRSYPSGTWRRP